MVWFLSLAVPADRWLEAQENLLHILYRAPNLAYWGVVAALPRFALTKNVFETTAFDSGTWSTLVSQDTHCLCHFRDYAVLFRYGSSYGVSMILRARLSFSSRVLPFFQSSAIELCDNKPGEALALCYELSLDPLLDQRLRKYVQYIRHDALGLLAL